MINIRNVTTFENPDRKTSVWEVIETGDHLVTESAMAGRYYMTELKNTSGLVISSALGDVHLGLLSMAGYRVLNDVEIKNLKYQKEEVTLETTISVTLTGTRDGMGNLHPSVDRGGDARCVAVDGSASFWWTPNATSEFKVVGE